ncbi:DUF1236 domain-containing protein [Microvirga sp. 2YAF29]|uniref:DUF1236 domain-containing protein n=1 Tax=Microvirga sp. 2YAF29 TaxID=3233031 RepID=UPI003F9CD77A
MRNILLSSGAVLALTLASAPAFAQTQSPGASETAPGQIKPPAISPDVPGKSESAPGQNRSTMSSDAPGRSEAAPGRSQSSTISSGSSSQQSGQPERPNAADSNSSSQISTQASEGQKRLQQDQSKSANDQRANPTKGSNSASQSSGDNRQEPTSSSAQRQNAQPEPSATVQQNSAFQQSGSTGSSTNAVANLNTEKRSEVTEAFSSTNVNTVTNVSFNVSVGTTITEDIRLAPLPTEVVRIVPQYRGYQYIVVREEIVIIEPKTKKIVEVIHKTGGSRKSASISLSSEQRRKFKTTVETTGSTRASTSRIEIREGVVLPQEVEILDVPQTIISDVPELRTYRYVVIGDEIALVEPSTRRVIEVIN